MELAVHFLEDDARAWWDSVMTRYRYQRVTWEIFKREFEQKYFPPEARDRMERQFMKLEQGEMNVREYEQVFMRLRRYLYSGRDDEASMVRRFLSGLRPEIAGRLQAVTYPHVNELAERAVNVEEGIAKEKGVVVEEVTAREVTNPEKKKGKVKIRNDSKHGRGSSGASHEKHGSASSKPLSCFRCGRSGHIARHCNTATPQGAKTVSATCFYCGEVGHYANYCPKKVGGLEGPQERQTLPARAAGEPAPKRQATAGRVYALDVELPGPPRPPTGPITGTHGF